MIVIPVAFSMKIIVAWDIMVMVAVPIVLTGMIVPVARVVPHVTAASTVIRMVPAIVTIAATVAPIVAMRIPNVDVNSARAKVNPLGIGLVRTGPNKAYG
jgi:hypothetical protein